MYRIIDKRMKSNFLYFFIVLLIIILDRISKIIIEKVADSYLPLSLINSFVNLDLIYVKNTGLIFGILSGYSNEIFVALITILSFVAALFLIVYLFWIKKRGFYYSICLSFIIGGAIGNIWDRIDSGYVVDFIDLYISNYHWPAFNLADSFITIGIVLLLIDLLRKRETELAK